MSLNSYKTETVNMCKKKGWMGPSIEHVWMFFTEEIGELASSIRRQRNQFRDKKRVKIESEMGDVFSYLFQLADMLEIDLDRMWTNQKNKMIKKHYQYSNNSSSNGSFFPRKTPMYWCNEPRSSMQESWKVSCKR